MSFEVPQTESRTVWGRPLAELLLAQVQREKSKACFVMVSGTLQGKSEEVQQAIKALGDLCCGVFEGVRPHTPREDVLAATEAARKGAADLVVTIGGGSLTDAGKCVCLLLEHEDVKTVEDFDKYKCKGSFFEPPHYEHKGKVRQIAVPTTLSGGEFTCISGVTNKAIPLKQGFVHPLLKPICVIFDAAITVHTPEWLWLSTGVRSVDHCVEGLCSIAANTYSDAEASAGLRLLVQGLKRVKAKSDDITARLDCQVGCKMAVSLVNLGIHFGASHAIGHVLGGTADVPHGYTSCVMLPAVVKYNTSAIGAKLPLLAELFGDPKGDAAEAISKFIAGLGMPRTLGEVKVSDEQLPKIAELAMGDPWMPTNPRKIENHTDVLEILKQAKGTDHATPPATLGL